ncbi:MAG: chorismate synthase, partial [Bdellovibrionales bacterium]
MSSSSFGSRFVITSFGESHGHAMGVVIDGCPSGVSWNQELIDENLRKRRPGQSST